MEIICANIKQEAEDVEDDGFETILVPETFLHCDSDIHLPQLTSGKTHNTTVRKTKPMEYKDLPFMGEMTLDNSKPRRGRKPKKSNICHLIYKNYGTIVPGTPKEMVQLNEQSSALMMNNNESKCKKGHRTAVKKLQSEQPLNLCVRDDDLGDNSILKKRQKVAHSTLKTVEPQIVSPQPQNEVSICKFKFTGGMKPTLQEKKMLSVDSEGNLRCYNSNGVNGSSNELRGYEFFSCSSPNSDECNENCHRHDDQKRRKTRKTLQRETLEKTFKETGFLIQTEQLESAQGATYCKFRQLRKFTRYLFRNWKEYLPKTFPIENKSEIVL